MKRIFNLKNEANYPWLSLRLYSNLITDQEVATDIENESTNDQQLAKFLNKMTTFAQAQK